MTAPVIIFEEHSSVLPEWKSRGICARTLVCFDAHLDFKLIASERIEALRRCRTATEIAAREKPHFLAADSEYCFTISDFVYAAHQLGFIDRMVWVCPGQSATTLIGEIKKKLQQLEGIPPADLKGLRQKRDYLELELLGLPIVICCYPQLGLLQLPRNALLDIDIDYFVSFPTERPWVDPKDLFDSVSQLGLEPGFVSITRSVRSGFMPLQYRYFADYLGALFEGDQNQAAHYSRLYEFDQRSSNQGGQTRRERYQAEIREFPECSATYYLLSRSSPDEQERLWAANTAESLCSEYRVNALRSACAATHSNRRRDAVDLSELEKEAALHPLPAPELHWFYAAMVLLSCQRKDRARARHYYMCYRRLAGEHSALQHVMALLLYRQGFDARAIALFHAASQEPSLRGKASLQLASLYLKRGNYPRALEHLKDARLHLPAAPEPARLQGHLYKRMGDLSAYRTAEQEYLDLSRIFLQHNLAGVVSGSGI